MKKKLIIIITGVILLALLILILSVLVFKKSDNNIIPNKQTVNIDEDKINVTVVNNITITNGNITKINNIYHITMTATNNTDKDIDMNDYRISFKNSKGEEIDWFNGSAIGVVKANEALNFVIDSYADLSDLKTIDYQKMLNK